MSHPDRRLLRFPEDRRHWSRRCRARRASAPRGGRLRPARVGVRDPRRRAHPDQLRQFTGEPARGAASNPGVRRTTRGGAGMNERPRVFVSRRIPSDALETIAEACDADVWEDDLPPPRDELLRRIAGCDGVLTLLTDKVDDAFLDAAGAALKVVSNYAVGFDNIDVGACARRGVAVGNTPGVLTETTADLAWALLMAAARRLPEGDRFVRDGKWKTWGPLLLLGPDGHGGTIGRGWAGPPTGGRWGSSGAGGSARPSRDGHGGSGWRSCTTTWNRCPRR